MKVSVCITTYNHEKFIAQAIESVLMQETDFDYEIIIGEDDSTDGTREIVKAYKETYPERIKLFLNDRKNVIYVDGRPTGRWNFVNNLKHAQGDYVSLLDGDDYWTSPDKLQKQVDFLDHNNDYVICFHKALVSYENGYNEELPSNSENLKETLNLKDLLLWNFIPTCAVIFRNRLFDILPDWYFLLPMGDWPLHILNARFGKIGYLNEVMGVHRIHKDGIWSNTGEIQKIENTMQLYKYVGLELGNQYKNTINLCESLWYFLLSKELYKIGEINSAKRFALISLKKKPLNPYVSKKRIFNILFISFTKTMSFRY